MQPHFCSCRWMEQSANWNNIKVGIQIHKLDKKVNLIKLKLTHQSEQGIIRQDDTVRRNFNGVQTSLPALINNCLKVGVNCMKISQLTVLVLGATDKQQQLHEENNIWANSWDYGTCHIGDQPRLRWAYAFAQSCQSLRCLHIWRMEVDKGSDQKSDTKPHWMAVHVQLTKEFTEDEKCHNLMLAHFQ